MAASGNMAEPDHMTEEQGRMFGAESLRRMRLFAERYRIMFTALGALLLLAGLIWSLTSQDVTWSRLHILPWLPYLLGLGLCSFLASAKSLQVSAHMARTDIGDRASLAYIASANLAELLPLPGGALLRTLAIRQAGASLGRSSSVILLSAVLTLALSLALAGGALGGLGYLVGWLLLAAGGAVSIALVFLIARISALPVAGYALALRLVLLGLSGLRLLCALHLLGEAASLLDAVLLSVSITAGTAVSLIPSGIGVSEALAAGLATLTTTAPALALLAVVLNRLVTLALSGVVILVTGVTHRRSALPEPGLGAGS